MKSPRLLSVARHVIGVLPNQMAAAYKPDPQVRMSNVKIRPLMLADQAGQREARGSSREARGHSGEETG
jgi:hypothetical protein